MRSFLLAAVAAHRSHQTFWKMRKEVLSPSVRKRMWNTPRKFAVAKYVQNKNKWKLFLTLQELGVKVMAHDDRKNST